MCSRSLISHMLFFSISTLFMVSGDHGEEFGEHGKRFHGRNLYDSQTRTPLLMLVPSLEGRRVTAPVSSSDATRVASALNGGSRSLAQNTIGAGTEHWQAWCVSVRRSHSMNHRSAFSLVLTTVSCLVGVRALSKTARIESRREVSRSL